MKLPAALRNLVADLVARRLWPVALALVVALVAVPAVVLAGAGDADPGDPSAQILAGEPAAVKPVEDETGVKSGGTARDPFKQPPAPKPESSGGQDGSGGSGGSGGSSPGGTSSAGGGLPGIDTVPVDGTTGGTSPGSGSGSASKPGAGKSDDNRDSWHVDLRFGKNGGTLTEKKDVPRLSPLPSRTEPFFVYLGIAADGKNAMFLVSSDATVTGDATCKPSKQNCERVHMEAGETAFFDVTTPEGQVVQYQLELVRISRKVAANAAVAKAARARESKAGREVLRKAVRTRQVDVSDLAYSRSLGLVVPTGAGAMNSALFGGFRVDLRFGPPGRLVKRYNLARLTPLPSVDDPSFVFLGVVGDGTDALFLNPSEAAAAGDAVCEPSPEECQRVRLGEGKSATFAAQAIDGSTTEYQLDVDAITPLQADTPEEAAASRRRESPAGRVVLRRLINEVGSLVGDLTFSSAKGIVEPAE